MMFELSACVSESDSSSTRHEGCSAPLNAELREELSVSIDRSDECLSTPVPMNNVEGKVAFITGGASGIGLGIASTFVDAGMKVVIGDCDEEHLDEAMKYFARAEHRVHPTLFNVTDPQDFERAAAETERVFGSIHVLVNNAGIQNPSTLSNMSYEEWGRLMAVNLNGVFNGIKTIVPRIKRHREGGQVIATASILGFFTVGGGYSAYCASKFAVIAMMESLRVELSESNIGVSVLCPASVKTNLEQHLRVDPCASEPLEIGRCLFEGMRRNEFYILPHPEFKAIIQARNDAIVSSGPMNLHPSNERNARVQSLLEKSIYLSGRCRSSECSIG